MCDIYAPNDYRERTSLWEWLENNLPKAHWIFFGHLNVVGKKKDKRGGNVQCWKGSKKLFWSSFKRNFRVIDPLGLKKNTFLIFGLHGVTTKLGNKDFTVGWKEFILKTMYFMLIAKMAKP